jgi:hypothetical protein
VLKIVVVMLERAARVVRRIDENTFHSSGIIGEQRFKRFKVVTLDQHVWRFSITNAVRVISL